MVYRFLYKFPKDADKLIDGRYISFVQDEVNIHRGKLFHVFNREQLCSYEEAKRLVDRFQPGKEIHDFFDELSNKEVTIWRKK